MNAAGADARYTLRDIQTMLGLSRSVVEGLVEAGFVAPTRGPRNQWRFSFQDVVLLRTAHRLRAAQVPPRRLLNSLRALAAQLPAELPLSGLRIRAVGNEVAVSAGGAQWEARSGQLLMDFEVSAERGRVAFIEAPAETAQALFDRAARLESDDPAAAEGGYRRVLAQDPGHAAAAINLSALLCSSARAAEAAELCRDALRVNAGEALLHFNLAIALEDLGQAVQALEHYGHCLRLDPSVADAHFNAARLHEQLGAPTDALRHYSAYRRLSRP